jgi:hypothetical protein
VRKFNPISNIVSNNWRNEIKFFTTSEEAKKLDNKLQQTFRADEHSNLGSYFVTSIYFESFDSNETFEKLSGDFLRHKYRIRAYKRKINEIESFKLERKTRYGTLINKSSNTIEANWPKTNFDLLKCKIDGRFFLDFKCALMELNLQPSVVVSYLRKAYSLSSKSRITIDFNVRSDAVCGYSSIVGKTPVTNSEWAIVEVKYPSNMLPSLIWELLERYDLKRTSSSKFLMAKRLKSSETWDDQ